MRWVACYLVSNKVIPACQVLSNLCWIPLLVVAVMQQCLLHCFYCRLTSVDIACLLFGVMQYPCMALHAGPASWMLLSHDNCLHACVLYLLN
jgi:hypothetical protein